MNHRSRGQGLRAGWRRALLLGLGASLLAGAATAQFKPPRPRPVAVPVNLSALDDALLLGIDDGQVGHELWRIDPITLQARLVRDIRPGPLGSHAGMPVRFGRDACFAATDGQHGHELWCTDGSADGTRLVADIRPGPDDSVPSALTVLGERLVFVADDGRHGFELWTSDGTAAGTRLLADVTPGPAGSNPRELTVVATASGPRLFFTADDGRHGAELWVSDGTPAGTRLVRDLRPGSDSGAPSKLTALGGQLFFVAHDGRHGPELWRSDGSARGTRLVRDLRPGPLGARPAQLLAWNGQLWFAADDGRHGVELWRSDGTAAGTRLVADLNPGPGHAVPAHLTAAAGTLMFAATDGASPVRLWRSDGTAAGTRPVAGVMPADAAAAALAARAQPGEEVPRQPVPGGEVPNRLFADRHQGTQRLLYAAMDDAAGYELWSTDGSAAGTRRLVEIAPGPADSFPHQFTRLGDRLFFVADDPRGLTSLWCELPDGRIVPVPLPTAAALATQAATAGTP